MDEQWQENDYLEIGYQEKNEHQNGRLEQYTVSSLQDQEKDDELIKTPFPADFDVGINSLSVEELQEQINLYQSDMMDDVFVSYLDVDIITLE